MQIENALAAATILARRGDYEPAREAASRFYTSLRAEVDRVDSAFEIRRTGAPALEQPAEQLLSLGLIVLILIIAVIASLLRPRREDLKRLLSRFERRRLISFRPWP